MLVEVAGTNDQIAFRICSGFEWNAVETRSIIAVHKYGKFFFIARTIFFLHEFVES